MDASIISRVAQETATPESSVAATVALLEKGATGPFIAHYRKEATGSLNEAKVRSIQERMTHYKEVWEQRAAFTKFLSEQGILTDELRARIENCFNKVELDDLHHQFRPRRKTRATEAIEKGLQPLAEYFWNQEPDAWSVEEHIDVFVDPARGISTREQALQAAVDIIAEWIYEDFDCRKVLREFLWNQGFVVSSVVPAKVGQKTKYNMYYERKESVTTIPSHRVLAIRRGCKEGILVSSIEGDSAKAVEYLLAQIIKEKGSIFAPILEAAARESYNRILRPLIETEVRTLLKERADREAIRVFQENLANLLLSPPAGPVMVMGIDWGKNGECSAAVVNEEGAFLEKAKIRLIPAPNAAEQKVAKESATSAPEAVLPAQPSALDAQALEPPPAEQTSEAQSQRPAETSSPISEPPPETSNPEPAPAVPATIPEAPDGVAGEQSFAGEAPDEAKAETLPVHENAVMSEALPAEPITAVNAAQAVPEAAERESDLRDQIQEGRKILRDLLAKYHIRAISIGTGIWARELENVLRQILSEQAWNDIMIASVNDAGIAIYASSRIAREEFPDWSASDRCAVSLARRLQDPLAELVKIDPKLIGVGQYQHDVDQKELHRGLLMTVQFCVNKVGVNINTAGESLLRYVSGLNEKLARRIIAVRKSHGPFRSRASLASMAGLDKTTYEQSAAFLRIPDGENPLDRTAIHPESYPLVEQMASALNVGINDLIGNKDLVASLRLEDFAAETAGIPTLSDIREELLRPGRDPRKAFKAPRFRPDVKEMADLKPGMTLEGTVTNVTNFGAFVDIGVKQDGLVHLSQMSNRFIRDPREAVKVGDVVQVKVISIELETKRIGLSMKALLPPVQRRRKRQLRRRPRPNAAASQSSAATEETAAGTSASSPSTPAGKNPDTGSRLKAGRSQEGYRRPQKAESRRPLNTEEARQQNEPAPKLPEPTLQEKIAILKSKFRGIS